MRNLADFDVLPPEGVNVESLLEHKALVLTSAARLKALEGALVMNATDVIKGPLITEKLDQRPGEVPPVRVPGRPRGHQARRGHARWSRSSRCTSKAVRTTIIRGKIKRVGRNIGKRPNFKKAIVTLKEGDKIDLFEGGAA